MEELKLIHINQSINILAYCSINQISTFILKPKILNKFNKNKTNKFD
jgi:hypothetical protein